MFKFKLNNKNFKIYLILMLSFAAWFFRGSNLLFFVTCTNTKNPLAFQPAKFERCSK